MFLVSLQNYDFTCVRIDPRIDTEQGEYLRRNLIALRTIVQKYHTITKNHIYSIILFFFHYSVQKFIHREIFPARETDLLNPDDNRHTKEEISVCCDRR